MMEKIPLFSLHLGINVHKVIPRLDRGIQRKKLDCPVKPDNDSYSEVMQCEREISRKTMKHNVCFNQHGMALVITLLVLVLLTAMVVEFSYGVYTGTNNLYNWRDAQRLSLMARSGINVSVPFLANVLSSGTAIPTQNFMEMPVENPFEDFQGTVTVRIEDENAKFNINTLVYPNGQKNTYDAFVRLLAILNLDERIAGRIADWIDGDSEARVPGSETGAENAYFVSIDELLLVHGIGEEEYDTLLPYVTVFGKSALNLEININTAGTPVLRCLAEDVTEEEAEQIVRNREVVPLKGEDFQRFTGSLPDTSIALMEKSSQFSVKSVASSGGVKRIIEAVWDHNGNLIEYWKEY
ncbi:MAG: type II secretion system minor pseudopilin GspK [Nitrospirota bacterium]